MTSALITGDVRALRQRGISEETARHFGYKVGSYRGQQVHICPLHNLKGKLVAQQLRTQDKEFPILGDFTEMPMFGTKLWNKGKKLIISEGSIDAMSISQVQDNKWPVISLPNGAGGAAKTIAANLPYFNGYEEIILMFDGDDAGEKAVAACAPLFPAGKCFVATINGYKDANEALMDGNSRAILEAMWGAKVYRPDGIVSLSDIREELEKPVEWGMSWYLDTLNKVTYGRRKGEVYCVGAGTGVGKTDFLTQQIVHDMYVLEKTVGIFFLEQMPVETAIRIAGKQAGKMFHIPDGDWTKEERSQALDELTEADRLRMYDSFGVCEWDVVKSNIEYMHHAEGIEIFYIDHLTALATGQGTDERVELERITSDIAKLAKRLNIIIIMVSHLATPDGKPHEEGGRVSIRHFKGSRAIGFWCHFMFGLERNQQAEDLTERQTTTFRVLKDRYTGQATGLTFPLNYNHQTGKLYEASPFDSVDVDTPF
jgi:twinkle protein